MNRNETEQKLTEIFKETFGVENLVLNNEMTANDVETWDSLTHMLMITKDIFVHLDIHSNFKIIYGVSC